jgi:hypothetical protein
MSTNPVVVVPGHMNAGTKLDASAIAYTKTYLQTFEKAAAATKTSAELICGSPIRRQCALSHGRWRVSVVHLHCVPLHAMP